MRARADRCRRLTAGPGPPADRRQSRPAAAAGR